MYTPCCFCSSFLVLWTPRQADAVNATISWTDNSSGTTQEDFFEIQSATTQLAPTLPSALLGKMPNPLWWMPELQAQPCGIGYGV